MEISIAWVEWVVKAAQGRIPVFLDGGICRGTDVFKALALGAAGVFLSTWNFDHIIIAN